jgi:hypothetical protein
MGSQLKSLRLSKTEPAVATRAMPFLNQIRIDLKKLTTLSNQAAAQGPAQGYGLAPGYKDWQNSTRPPQDSRYPQGSQYPQDSTTFRRPQRDTQGQQGMRGQGLQTCFRCGGSYRFTEYKCQGLKGLIQQGLVHLSNRGRLVARTRERPRPVLPWLSNEGRLKGIKDWLSTYQRINLDRLKEEQTRLQAPIVRTDFTAFHNRVVLQNSDEMWAN